MKAIDSTKETIIDLKAQAFDKLMEIDESQGMDLSENDKIRLVNDLTRIQNEIKRLEGVILKQSQEHDEEMVRFRAQFVELELKMSQFERQERQDISDLTELSILFEMSCNLCEGGSHKRDRIASILEKLRSRKL